MRRKGDGGDGGGSAGQSCAGDCCAGLAGLAGVAKCGDARLEVGCERLGRGGARALRGVNGRRRGGVLGLGGAAAASSELWLCMTASSSSSSTCRHLSKMEGILAGLYEPWLCGARICAAQTAKEIRFC